MLTLPNLKIIFFNNLPDLLKIITLVFAMFTQRSHLLQKYNNLCKQNIKISYQSQNHSNMIDEENKDVFMP